MAAFFAGHCDSLECGNCEAVAFFACCFAVLAGALDADMRC